MENNLVESFKSQFRHDYTSATLTNYVSDINQFLNYVGKNSLKNTQRELVASLTWGECNQYKNYMVDKNLKESTVNRKIESIRTFLDYCIKEKIINENHMKEVKRLKTQHIEQKTEFITQQEIEALLQTIKTRQSGDRYFEFISARDSLLYTIILTVGLRIKEAVSIRFEDFSIENMSIKTIGKGEKFREVPINQNIVNLYHAYMIEREKISISEKNQDLLFVSGRGGEVSTQSSNLQLTKYCKRANVKNISNHVLRHTCATHLANRNIPTNTISKMLGHKNIATTSRYIHSSLDLMREAITN